jgi:drug/metabolite transporter (DMT)-like permease
LPLEALLLILVAAFAHSAWNLLAKRASRHRHLIWFSSLSETVLFLPLAVWIGIQTRDRFNWHAAVFLLATGILHIWYTESLLRGYRAGDLSLVYPLARGTGPLISFLGAIFLLRERPSLLAGAGALLIAVGIVLVSGGIANLRGAGLFWGVMTGLTIASYTLVDGYSVKVLLLSPVIIDYAGNLFRTIVLSHIAWRDRAQLPAEYQQCWKEALGIGILTPAGYILVLFAMQIAPISHVAPAREMSMMIGAWFGARVLKEGHLARRMTGSALIAAGVAGLTLG